jgi:hypothetical protein
MAQRTAAGKLGRHRFARSPNRQIQSAPRLGHGADRRRRAFLLTSRTAVILHNRRDELLILGTEIGATAATPIIRFIPFPAARQVSTAPPHTFDHVKATVSD